MSEGVVQPPGLLVVLFYSKIKIYTSCTVPHLCVTVYIKIPRDCFFVINLNLNEIIKSAKAILMF